MSTERAYLALGEASSLAARYLEKKTRWFRVESAICSIYPARARLFRVNPAKSFNQPDFSFSERLFWSIIGSASGEPGETGRGGGSKKNQNIGEFSFRGILQPTTFLGFTRAGRRCPYGSSRALWFIYRVMRLFKYRVNCRAVLLIYRCMWLFLYDRYPDLALCEASSLHGIPIQAVRVKG